MLLSIKENNKDWLILKLQILPILKILCTDTFVNHKNLLHFHYSKHHTMLVNQEQWKYIWHTKNKILSTSDSMKNKLWQLYFSYDTRTFWQLSSLLQISRGLKWINVRWISQILFKLTEDHACTATLNSQH